jgi:hypothetical protein
MLGGALMVMAGDEVGLHSGTAMTANANCLQRGELSRFPVRAVIAIQRSGKEPGLPSIVLDTPA